MSSQEQLVQSAAQLPADGQAQADGGIVVPPSMALMVGSGETPHRVGQLLLRESPGGPGPLSGEVSRLLRLPPLLPPSVDQGGQADHQKTQAQNSWGRLSSRTSLIIHAAVLAPPTRKQPAPPSGSAPSICGRRHGECNKSTKTSTARHKHPPATFHIVGQGQSANIQHAPGQHAAGQRPEGVSMGPPPVILLPLVVVLLASPFPVPGGPGHCPPESESGTAPVEGQSTAKIPTGSSSPPLSSPPLYLIPVFFCQLYLTKDQNRGIPVSLCCGLIGGAAAAALLIHMELRKLAVGGGQNCLSLSLKIHRPLGLPPGRG